MSYIKYKEERLKRLATSLLRNCLLKHVIEGKIQGRTEVTRIRGRRRKQLLDYLKEEREYWNLKEEALKNSLVVGETVDLYGDRPQNA